MNNDAKGKTTPQVRSGPLIEVFSATVTRAFAA
jgi:hypothetical protein